MNTIFNLINEELNTWLSEMFEANVKTYSWTKESEPDLYGNNEYYYEFITEDGDKYLVDVERYEDDDENDDSWTLNFNPEGYTYTATLNKGRFQRVMATIVSIANDFIKTENPDKITITPSKISKEDNRRFNIYLGYIKSHLPSNYTLTVNNNPSKPQIFVNKIK